MIGLLAYSVLAGITALMLISAYQIFGRTRDLSLPVALGLLFLWTFAGGWAFVTDALIGFNGYRIGLSYYYLMEKMFPFVLNENYLSALLQYAAFAASFGVVLLFGSRSLQRIGPSSGEVRVDVRPILVLSLLALCFSAWCIWPQISATFNEGGSIYRSLAGSEIRLASLHGLANEVLAFGPIISLALLLGGGLGHVPFTVERTAGLPLLLGISVALMGVYLIAIGERQVLLFSLLVGAMFLARTASWQGLKRAASLVVICGALLFMGTWVRSLTLTELRDLERVEPDHSSFAIPSIAHVPRQPQSEWARIGSAFWSNELFAAHFSMFGTIEERVQTKPLISFKYLFCSLVPSAIGGERPPTAYAHYARSAGLSSDQGFTIHHATAWRINLGPIGPLIGGISIALIFLGIHRLTLFKGNKQIQALLWMLPIFAAASLIMILRSGPEVYKALLIEGLFIPLLVMATGFLRTFKAT